MRLRRLRKDEKKRNFMSEAIFTFSLVRGGLFVNRATVLVLHLCSLEHLIAFSLLACVFVIAWLAVDFRLFKVGMEVARIKAVAHIHDEFGMAYFGTGRDKKAIT